MWRIRYALQVLKRRPRDRGGRSDTDPGRTDRTCDHLQITAYQSGADNIRKDYQRKFRDLRAVSTGKKEMTTGYVRGEVTVYLTLTFILLVSLVLALTESASIQMAKNYRSGRYEPGSGVRICGISKKNFWNIMMYLP